MRSERAEPAFGRHAGMLPIDRQSRIDRVAANHVQEAEPQPLEDVGRRIEAALEDLRRVSSAARHGDQLAAVIVDAHAAAFRRLRELSGDPDLLTADPALAELWWVHEAALDGSAIETMGARIDTLRASIEQSGVPGLVDAADRLIDAVTELHGWALARSIDVLHDAGRSEALRAAVDDELIAALLLAHGMHPEPLAERVQLVLDACATAIGEHAGHVELVESSAEEARVRLRISGGDERQRWRTRLAVERAVRDLVADVVRLEIEGADEEPRGTPSPTIIPLTSIGRRRTTRWTALPELDGLGPGEVVQLVYEGKALVACRIGDDVFVVSDPFSTNSLRIVDTDPLTIEAGDGSRLVVTDPFPTHSDGEIVEVLL